MLLRIKPMCLWVLLLAEPRASGISSVSFFILSPGQMTGCIGTQDCLVRCVVENGKETHDIGIGPRVAVDSCLGLETFAQSDHTEK